MIFSEENKTKVKRWKEYIDKGYYGDARDIVDTYNEVYKNERQIQGYTSCGSCLRRFINTMYQDLSDIEEKAKEAKKKAKKDKK